MCKNSIKIIEIIYVERNNFLLVIFKKIIMMSPKYEYIYLKITRKIIFFCSYIETVALLCGFMLFTKSSVQLKDFTEDGTQIVAVKQSTDDEKCQLCLELSFNEHISHKEKHVKN